MKVLALDPGGTTGWAIYCDYDPSIVPWSHGQIGPKEHHEDLYDFMEDVYRADFYGGGDKYGGAAGRREPLWLVCESFQYRNNLDKAELISCEYIGIVKYFRLQCYDVRVIWQTASMGKIREQHGAKQGSFVQKKHLQRLNLWVPGMTHAMDAYGHLIYYAIHGGNPEFKELGQSLLQKGWRP